MDINAFSPCGASATRLSPNATAATALTLSSTPGAAYAQLFTNDTDKTVFVAFGNSTVTTDATGCPVKAGLSKVFQPSESATHMATYVGSAATGSVYATPGRGF